MGRKGLFSRRSKWDHDPRFIAQVFHCLHLESGHLHFCGDGLKNQVPKHTVTPQPGIFVPLAAVERFQLPNQLGFAVPRLVAGILGFRSKLKGSKTGTDGRPVLKELAR